MVPPVAAPFATAGRYDQYNGGVIITAATAPSIEQRYDTGPFTFVQSGTIRWYSDTSNGAYTAGNGNQIQYSFNGVCVHIYGSKQARGAAAIPVEIDGVTYTMSCYNGGSTASQYDVVLLDVPVLPNVPHTLTITNPVRGKYLYFHRMIVDQPPPIDVAATLNPGAPLGTVPIQWGPTP